MNRWVSADPLAVHVLGADPNVYAYVSGAPLKNVDPLGLQEEPYAAGTDPATGASEGYTVDQNLQTNQIVEFTRPDTITATGVKPPDRSEASPPIIGGGSSGSAAGAQGATKAERWEAAKGGAQNWFVDQAETIVYGPALKWLGGKALEFTSMRAPEPSAKPSNLREWELRQQYDFMQGGLTFEAAAGGAVLAGAGFKGRTPGAPRAYSVAYEAEIPNRGSGKYQVHFADANESLLRSMSDPGLSRALRKTLGKNFEGSILDAEGNVAGRSPAGWSWHHSPDRPGILQLVPRAQHQSGLFADLFHPLVGGTRKGGMATWGSKW